MVLPDTIEERLAGLVRREEVIDGTLYVVYRIPGQEFIVFKYDKALVDSFPMTQEEKELGVRLCLEARMKDPPWFGDVLTPFMFR